MTTTNNSQGNQGMTAEDKSQPNARQPKPPPNYPPPADRHAGPPPSADGGGDGYFTIYKKGQGYWTRMGTVAAISLIGILFGRFLWEERIFFGLSDRATYLVILIGGLAYALLAFHVLNKASNVDFLIATDSEMKRVNWTSKKDLFGSTKVVIAFMFIVAIVLFTYDLFFQTVFYLIGVLKTPPPFFPDKH
jgi:preprotein translocase subunit SecE